MHWGIDGQDRLSTQWSGAIQPNRKNRLGFFGPESVLTVQGMGSRGYATRKKVDIGARARQLQTRRLWGLVLAGTLVSGFIIVVLNTFQENLMYYITPSEVGETE